MKISDYEEVFNLDDLDVVLIDGDRGTKKIKVSKIASSDLDSEAWAVGTMDGVPVTDAAPQYHNNSKYYAERTGQYVDTAVSSAEAAVNASIVCGSAMRIAGESRDEAVSAAETAIDASVISGSAMRIAGVSRDEAVSAASAAVSDAYKSEGYAVGTEDGLPVGPSSPYYNNNSKHWAEVAQAAAAGGLIPRGTCTFANLPTIAESHTGDMWNISDEFTTTSDFREGAGYVIPAGAEIYLTVDGKWDVLAGTPVSGVKGNAESNYRKGNVNLTFTNLGSSQDGRLALGLGDSSGALPLTVAQGGTGATDVAGAQTNLGIPATYAGSSTAGGDATRALAALSAYGNKNITFDGVVVRTRTEGIDQPLNVSSIAFWDTNVVNRCPAADVRNFLGLGFTTSALPIANGGTGATDAATARANLGIGGNPVNHLSDYATNSTVFSSYTELWNSFRDHTCRFEYTTSGHKYTVEGRMDAAGTSYISSDLGMVTRSTSGSGTSMISTFSIYLPISCMPKGWGFEEYRFYIILTVKYRDKGGIITNGLALDSNNSFYADITSANFTTNTANMLVKKVALGSGSITMNGIYFLD